MTKLTVANENIADSLSPQDLAKMQEQLEQKFREVLEIMCINQDADPNTQGTAKRVAKMYVHELFAGRFKKAPDMTTFPNTNNVDELIVIGPISVNSTCSHHFVPIVGKAWIGYLPGKVLLGLSKFHRMSHHIFRRPQIQEEATMQLARQLNGIMRPRALGVVVKSQHFCCTCRGVEDPNTLMTTQVMLGEMNGGLKNEFLSTIKD